MEAMRKIVTPAALASIIFLVLFFGSANYIRQRLIDRYNQGVQYYENGNYEAAMEVFGGLYGWGTCVDISPEEYYDMAFDRLLEQKPSVKRCPHCGLLIE